MKKLIFILPIACLILFGLAAAQDLNDIQGQIQNRTNLSGAQESSNRILEQQVEIPENFRFVPRFLFGLQLNQEISFQLFIILIGSWIILYVGFTQIIKIMPFFDGGKAWIASFCVMVLMGISGGLILAANFLIDLSTLFGVLKGWEIVGLAIALVFLVIVYFFIAKVSKMLRNKMHVEENEITGLNINTSGKIAKAQIDGITENE